MGKVVKKVGGVFKKAAKVVVPAAVGFATGGVGGAVMGAAGGLMDGGGGGIASTAGSLIGAYGDYKAGKEQAKATKDAVGIADPFAPYRAQYASALTNLYNDPSRITQLPSYQFRLNQGLDSINRNAAAKGYLGSGNRLMELMRYGQDYGSQEFDKEVARLSGLSGATTGSPAQAGILQTQYASSLGDSYRNTAGSIGAATRRIGGLFGSGTSTPPFVPERTQYPMTVNLPGGGSMLYER